MQRRSYEDFAQWTVKAGLSKKDERTAEDRLDPPYDLLLPPTRPDGPDPVPKTGRNTECECRRLLREGRPEETCARLLLTTKPGTLPPRFPCYDSTVLGASHTWYACDRYPPAPRLPYEGADPWLNVWWHFGWTLAAGSAVLAESRAQLSRVAGVSPDYALEAIPTDPLLDDPDARIGF